VNALAITELPADWQAYPWPTGWDTGRLTFERIGYTLIPTRFLLAVRTPATGDGAVILDFAAKNGAASIAAIRGAGVDLTEHLVPVVTAKTSAEWSKYAQWRIVHFLVDTDPTHGDPDSIAAIEKEVRPLLDALQGSHGTQTRSRNNSFGLRRRITNDHLNQVAAVYQQAADRGEGPTRAVANHFGVAHSTAAKWAGHARTRGLLAPTMKGLPS
jgi:hypothetical protein